MRVPPIPDRTIPFHHLRPPRCGRTRTPRTPGCTPARGILRRNRGSGASTGRIRVRRPAAPGRPATRVSRQNRSDSGSTPESSPMRSPARVRARRRASAASAAHRIQHRRGYAHLVQLYCKGIARAAASASGWRRAGRVTPFPLRRATCGRGSADNAHQLAVIQPVQTTL